MAGTQARRLARFSELGVRRADMRLLLGNVELSQYGEMDLPGPLLLTLLYFRNANQRLPRLPTLWTGMRHSGEDGEMEAGGREDRNQ